MHEAGTQKGTATRAILRPFPHEDLVIRGCGEQAAIRAEAEVSYLRRVTQGQRRKKRKRRD